MKRINKLLFYFTLLLTSLCVVGCSEDSTATPDDSSTDTSNLDLVLVPSATEIALSGSSSYIDFQAYFGETNVSSDRTLSIYLVDDNYNLTSVEYLRYTIPAAGTYRFYATCANSSGKVVQSANVEVVAYDTSDFYITPSVTEIIVGTTESNKVEFTATYNGVEIDPTDENLKFFVVDGGSETQLDAPEYVIEDDRTCSFYATYVTLDTEITSPSVEVTGVMTLYLSLSDSSVDLASGSQTVTLIPVLCSAEITLDDQNLKAYLVNSDNSTTELSSLNYEISEAGTYSFRVTYGAYSAEAGVLAMNSDISSLSYQKRVLGIQFTASWCGYCPMITSAIHNFEVENGTDRAVFAAAHGSDAMSNDYSTYLISKMGITGYPTLLVGSVNSSYTTKVGAYTTIAYTLSLLTSTIETYEELDTATAIAVTSSYDSEKIYISSHVAVRTDGQYGVGAMVLEDDIYASQTSYYSDLDAIGLGDYDTSNHVNVVQGVYPTDSTIPVTDLGGVSSHTSGLYTFDCEFDIADLTSLSNIDNCRIVIYTYNKVSGYVDNVIQAPINNSKYFDLN